LRQHEDFNTSVDKLVEITPLGKANSPFFNRVHRFALFWCKASETASRRNPEQQR
jgi:hypothetical protein